MFRIWKRKERNEPSAQFHVLLLSGDAVKLSFMDPIAELSDAELDRLAFFVDDDESGGMVVTPDNPDPLKARYLTLGFKVVVVPIPKKRSNETAYVVSTNLRSTSEYRQLR